MLPLSSSGIEAHAVCPARAGVTGLVTKGSNVEAVDLDGSEHHAVTARVSDELDRVGFSSLPVVVGCIVH